MKFLGQQSALMSLLTRRFSLCLCAVVDEMHLARSIKILTRALLPCAGLCKWKSKYLLECVALRCTPTSIFPNSFTVLLVSRKALLFLSTVVACCSHLYWKLNVGIYRVEVTVKDLNTVSLDASVQIVASAFLYLPGERNDRSFAAGYVMRGKS